MLVNVVTGLAFGGIALAIFLAARWFKMWRHNPVGNRLPQRGERVGGTARWLGDELAEDLAGQLPENRSRNGELDVELRQAGFFQPIAVRDYLAARNFLTISVAIGCGIAAVLIGPDRPTLLVYALAGGAIVSGLSWALPRVVVKMLATRRQERIRRALPNALDIIGMCLAGGLDLPEALAQTCGEIESAHPDLAFEFRIVQHQAEMESLEFAFAQFAQRVASADVEALAGLIRQNARLGTNVAEAMEQYADDIRLQRRQFADEKAGNASVKLMLPISLCLLPSAMIILWGPAVLELWNFLSNFDEAGLMP